MSVMCIVRCEVLTLTQISDSLRTLSLLIGLSVKATVATGARAKNILILLASSGIVEKAIKATKAQTRSCQRIKFV